MANHKSLNRSYNTTSNNDDDDDDDNFFYWGQHLISLDNLHMAHRKKNTKIDQKNYDS